jgi:hypothetical protein
MGDGLDCSDHGVDTPATVEVPQIEQAKGIGVTPGIRHSTRLGCLPLIKARRVAYDGYPIRHHTLPEQSVSRFLDDDDDAIYQPESHALDELGQSWAAGEPAQKTDGCVAKKVS